MTSLEHSTGGHETATDTAPTPDRELDAIRAERLAAMDTLAAAETQPVPAGGLDTEPARQEQIADATSDVYALFGETPLEPTASEPRALGSADGDWDFVRNQRANGGEVSVADDLSVTLTDEQGNSTFYKTFDEARAAAEAPTLSPEQGAAPAPAHHDDTLGHVESLIARHESKGDKPHDQKAAALASAMERQGIEARYERFAPDSAEAQAYEGMFVFQPERPAGDTEPRVRLYRGVGQLDMNIFQQQSYAEKGVKSDWPGQRISTPAEKQQAIDEVRAFQTQPSYDAFLQYAQTLARVGGSDVARRMKDRIRDVEDDILNRGSSIQEALAWEHIKSASGVDAGIDVSPYISVGDSAEVGGVFAGRGMIVYDVPISMIAGRGESGELLISGQLTQEHVAALAVRKGSSETDNYGLVRNAASRAVGERTPRADGVIDSADATMTFSRQDADQQARDVQAIHTKRSRELLLTAGGAKVAEELGLDLEGDLNYQQTKEALYDYFSSKLEHDPTQEFTYRGEFRQEKVSREALTDQGIAAMKREYNAELDRQANVQHRREERARHQAQQEQVAADPRAALQQAIRHERAKVGEYVAYAGYRGSGPVQLREQVAGIQKTVDTLASEDPSDTNLAEAQKILSHIRPNMDSAQLQRILSDADKLVGSA